MTSDPNDIPSGNVYQHYWIGEGDAVEDDVIGQSRLESHLGNISTVVSRSVTGRRIVGPQGPLSFIGGWDIRREYSEILYSQSEFEQAGACTGRAVLETMH